MDKLYAGIDGGGTKTKCVVGDKDKIYAEYTTGSSNPNYQGFEKAINNITESINGCLERMGKESTDVKFHRICLGLSGAGPINRPILRDKLSVTLSDLGFNVSSIVVTHDALLAWLGAFDGNDGIIVISGTGSEIFGKANNKSASSSFSKFKKAPLLKGGGFHIGLYGVKVCLNHMIHKRESILLKSIEDAYNKEEIFSDHKDYILKTLFEDAVKCFKGENMQILGRKDVASISKYVHKAAEKGDNWAIMIINQAGKRITYHISYVAERLGISGERFKVALIGSGFKSVLIKYLVRRDLPISEPRAEIVSPKYQPEEAALKIAREYTKGYILKMLGKIHEYGYVPAVTIIKKADSSTQNL